MSDMLAEKLVITNRLEELRRMSQWLQDSAAALGIDGDQIFALDVCANEAVTNIISYAYADGLSHTITLEFRTSQGHASLEIRDDGMPFNLLDAQERKLPEALDVATVGGLGIHLIKRLMPHCRYQRAGGFNVLSLEV